MGTEERLARLVWQYGEPIHAVAFFAPEIRAATDALGLKGGWMSYFGCRASPLGTVPAAVVTSIFYGFHPRRVEARHPRCLGLRRTGTAHRRPTIGYGLRVGSTAGRGGRRA